MSSQTVFVTAGKTSFSHDVNLVQNAGATSPGNPITGKAYNTSSLTAYYRIPNAGTLTAITLATQTVGGAWSSGGFVEVSSTNDPGGYRFDVPNAVLATACVSKVVFNGSTDMATHTIYYVCMAVDFFTNTYLPTEVTRWNGVALTGKTGTLAGLAIFDSGTAQGGTSGSITLRAALSSADNVPNLIIGIIGGTGAGQARVGTTFTNSTKVLLVDPIWTTTPDNTSVYEAYFSPPAPIATLPTALLSVGTGTGQVNLSSGAVPVTGDLTATMKTSVGTAVAASAVASVTGNVGGNVTGSVGSLAAQAKTDVATAALTTAMTESYAADGATMTLAQAMYLVTQGLGEVSVSGTTLTVKKLDGSTTAATYTLSDATSPVSRTRAT